MAYGTHNIGNPGLDRIPVSGVGHSGQYMASAIPFLSASVTVEALGETPIRITFPNITKFVTIRNTISTGSAEVPLRVGFSSLGTTGSNYLVLNNGESYSGEWRVSEVWLLSDVVSNQTSASVVVGMTGIKVPANDEFLNWSGSTGIG